MGTAGQGNPVSRKAWSWAWIRQVHIFIFVSNNTEMALTLSQILFQGLYTEQLI